MYSIEHKMLSSDEWECETLRLEMNQRKRKVFHFYFTLEYFLEYSTSTFLVILNVNGSKKKKLGQLVWKKNPYNFDKLFKKITDANQASFRFLAEANNQSEIWWSIFLYKFLKYGLLSIPISAVLTTIVSLMTEGKYVTEISYHSYKST